MLYVRDVTGRCDATRHRHTEDRSPPHEDSRTTGTARTERRGAGPPSLSREPFDGTAGTTRRLSAIRFSGPAPGGRAGRHSHRLSRPVDQASPTCDTMGYGVYGLSTNRTATSLKCRSHTIHTVRFVIRVVCAGVCHERPCGRMPSLLRRQRLPEDGAYLPKARPLEVCLERRLLVRRPGRVHRAARAPLFGRRAAGRRATG